MSGPRSSGCCGRTSRGFILAPNTDTEHAQDVIQWLAESGRPSVLVERDAFMLPGHEPVESVRTDHALGAVLAARHLAELGHRRVGLVLSRNSPDLAQDRRRDGTRPAPSSA